MAHQVTDRNSRELDVEYKRLPKEIEDRDRIVSQAYEDYLSVVLDEPAVITVIPCGFGRSLNMYNNSKYGGVREDGGKPRSLPLDDQMNRKLAWNAMARAFDNAPKR